MLKLKNIICVLSLGCALLLTACGQTGPLYLTKQDIVQHQTVDQPQAPSNALQPMTNNQRVLNDV